MTFAISTKFVITYINTMIVRMQAILSASPLLLPLFSPSAFAHSLHILRKHPYQSNRVDSSKKHIVSKHTKRPTIPSAPSVDTATSDPNWI